MQLNIVVTSATPVVIVFSIVLIPAITATSTMFTAVVNGFTSDIAVATQAADSRYNDLCTLITALLSYSMARGQTQAIQACKQCNKQQPACILQPFISIKAGRQQLLLLEFGCVSKAVCATQ